MLVVNVFDNACISIHALHEENDLISDTKRHFGALISIHALHEESDARPATASYPVVISIHALHEESDPHVERTG